MTGSAGASGRTPSATAFRSTSEHPGFREIDGNPISAIARDFDIATHRTDWGNGVFHYHGVGEPASPAGPGLRDFWRLAEENPGRNFQSVYEEMLASGTFSEADRRYLEYLLTTEVVNEYAADLTDLSYASVDGGSGFLRGGDVVFPGGYGQIVDVLARGGDDRGAGRP